MTSALRLNNVTVESAEGRLINGVSLDLPAGGFLTILGESGSGKSLLAQAVMGSLPSGLTTSGEVAVLGQTSQAADAGARRPLWGRSLSLLPQEPWLALDPTMRVGAQIAEVYADVGGRSWPDARQRADQDLTAAGLDSAARLYPHVLSGGMAQRVALAATRAGGAPLLIVDEPTKGLDAPLRDNVLIDLRRIVAGGGAVLTITHDVHIARALGGRIAVMLDGELVEQGEATQVLQRPAHPYTRALLAADTATWSSAPDSGGSAAGAPILSARAVAKAYGGRRLFEGVDITVGAGERIAISGPSGSGKSTLGNVLLGLRRPDSGEVSRAPGLSRFAFQKLYQDPVTAFAPQVTIGQALRDLVKLHSLAWAEAEALMQRLRLNARLLDRLPSEISGGELQRFAVVRVLLLKPALIFADEPTSRLDPISQQQTFELLLEAVAALGCALIVVTHDPDIARAVSARVIRLGEAETAAA